MNEEDLEEKVEMSQKRWERMANAEECASCKV